jgi:hypothetical protein
VEGRRKSPSWGEGERGLSTGNCNVLLCFISNYICESLITTLLFRSKRSVLNCSRLTDVSTPKLHENKHSANNEA